ncbi:MAG: CHASE2 domain-containing protein, partial [Oscillospiraceae bacterium]
ELLNLKIKRRYSVKNKYLKKYTFPLLAAVIFAALPLIGAFYTYDNILADGLYQKPQALNGEIVMLEIDSAALEELGPFSSWGRSVMAEIIEKLNAHEENRPAVIGIDVIYSGESQKEDDERLANAAKMGENVIMAAAASFGENIIISDSGFYVDSQAVMTFDEPYAALKAATKQGHINAMNDRDGIIRHCILKIQTPQAGEVFSFNYEIARMYSEKMGLEQKIPKTDGKNQWYLEFSAMPKGFSDGFSVIDLLNGSLPPEVFADKIVLIGPFAAGLNDKVVSAIDHAAPMYGIEYQANAINAILNGNFKREASVTFQSALIFVITFLYALWLRDRKVLEASLSLVFLICISFGICIFADSAGFILMPLYLPLMAVTLYIASVAANYVRAALEKRHITSTFQNDFFIKIHP